jgi:hypothetical protein
MADQSIQFSEGIAKDIMVKIQDHYAPADFIFLDMEEEDVHLSFWEDRSQHYQCSHLRRIWINTLPVHRRKGTLLF